MHVPHVRVRIQTGRSMDPDYNDAESISTYFAGLMVGLDRAVNIFGARGKSRELFMGTENLKDYRDLLGQVLKTSSPNAELLLQLLLWAPAPRGEHVHLPEYARVSATMASLSFIFHSEMARTPYKAWHLHNLPISLWMDKRSPNDRKEAMISILRCVAYRIESIIEEASVTART